MPTITITSLIPPARFDDRAWTAAHIQESAFKAGPWVDIDTIAISADTHPDQPAPHSFTTSSATLLNAWYRVMFYDAFAASSEPSDPQLVAPDYAIPSMRDVARRIPLRTRTGGGQLLGVFTAQTAPFTPEAVQGYISDARDAVYGRLGVLADPNHARTASGLMALYAAMEAELGLASEQVISGNSPYDKLKDLYDEGMKAEIEALGAEGNSAVDDDPTTPSRMGNFGDTGCLRVGMNTKW